MEGRRVTRKNQKYNPLFILFLCLVAAVIILLIMSIVFGLRLGSVSKKLKASEEEVKELTATVSRLEEELEDARKKQNPTTPNQPALPSTGQIPTNTTEPAGTGTDVSWLDLSGHSEVTVKPTNVLDGYATYYTTAGVNLRSGPGTNYDRITTIDYAEKVQVAAQEGGWSFVKYGSKFGWVSADYLSTSAPAPQTTARRTETTSGSIRR